MSGSFNKIDYRLRPAKHAERLMLADLFRRMQFAPIEQYRYVGFGSVGFVDFRLFHRALGIEEMISIEDATDEEEKERFRRNTPFAGVTVEFGHSNSALPKIDFKRRSIVWLDYDEALARWMANDIAAVAREAASGTFVGVTFPVGFVQGKKPVREKELGRLKTDFVEFVPADAKPAFFDGAAKYAEFGRFALGSLLQSALDNADAGLTDPDKKRTAHQVCYFRYKDGASMATVGWLIVAAEDETARRSSRFEDLPFYRNGDIPMVVKVPLVTPLEVQEMEKRLPGLLGATDIDWIPTEQREAFHQCARYLPRFATLEGV